MNIYKYSASQIDMFLSCRRKYYYSKILNIQPVERPESLDFGSAVHRGLASILRSIANTDNGDRESDRALNTREIAREYALQAVREYCEEYALSAESECKAIALIDSYIDLYFLEDLQNFDVLCVETYFDVPFVKSDDVESHLHGYFDGIIKNRHDGKIYVIEHKTTSVLNDSFLDRAKIDWQVMIYILACTTVYGHCDGVIYDVISKPKHTMSIGETDEEFEERKAASKTGRIKRKEAETKEQFISRMQASFSEESFARDTITIEPVEYGTRIAELTWVLNDMREIDNPIRYYKCTGNCLKFGACPYMDLCGGKVTVDNLGDKYINCNEEICNE